jgi:hypothetical protein
MCGNYNFKFFILRIARIGDRASQMKKTSLLHFNGPSQSINICHMYCFFFENLIFSRFIIFMNFNFVIAPEMKEGRKYGKPVDVYALGVLAYVLYVEGRERMEGGRREERAWQRAGRREVGRGREGRGRAQVWKTRGRVSPWGPCLCPVCRGKGEDGGRRGGRERMVHVFEVIAYALYVAKEGRRREGR